MQACRSFAARAIRWLLIGSLLCVAPYVLAQCDENVEPEYDETIAVTAELGGIATGPPGISSTTVDRDRTAGAPAAVTELVVEAAGVSENGQGGLFQVFSIRGVAGRRVRSLISGVRITSERRAGPSTSFLDAALMDSVDVLRGSTTTFYGSGALGGVVQVLPRTFDSWAAEAGYTTDGDGGLLMAGVGGESWSVGIARRESEQGQAPDGTLLNTSFTQHSAVLRGHWRRGSLQHSVLFVPSEADDIGKSNTDFPDRTTIYPRETHQLLEYSVKSDRSWSLRAFAHAQDLETEVTEDGRRDRIFNDSVDLGLAGQKTVEAGRATLTFGVDGFARRGVDSEERRDGEPAPIRTLESGRETEAGIYAAAQWDYGKANWSAGARLSTIAQENAGFDEERQTAWSGYVGASRYLAERLELRGSVSTGLRFPSLSELFFSGTTGRGSVTGNPSLREERAVGGELGLRWLGRHVLMDLTVFRSDFDDYIERIEVAPDELTFVNLTSGTIDGVELQGLYHNERGWQLGWGGHRVEGDDGNGRSLPDTPVDEIYLSGGLARGAWTASVRVAARDEKDDAASGEKAIPSATLLSATLGYRVSDELMLHLSGANLLDEEYFRSADRKAPLAPESSVALRLVWTAR